MNGSRFLWAGLLWIGAAGVIAIPASCAAGNSGSNIRAIFDRNDLKRPRIAVDLVPVISGLIQPTDIQFVPSDPRLVIVLEKTGKAKWFDLGTGASGLFFEVDVLTDSEQGLLGLTFHPRFEKNGRLFVDSTVTSGGQEVTRIAEWSVPPGSNLRKLHAIERRVVLEVVQPYANHNAGQLAFGPDNDLYIGFGDGGSANDPHGNGQNPGTLLGSMLRIDVDVSDAGPGEKGRPRAYGIPRDNPFVGREGYRPELWAIGLRNPWRYSFDPAGRLIAADVGQDSYEEIDIIERGGNYGWNVREARHCFPPEHSCKETAFIDPIFEYGRDDGGSVTGGYVALRDHVPALEGKYVFGDFLSGRIWALDLPKGAGSGPALAKVYALGRWPILPSTFGQDSGGVVYVADYPGGRIYRIDPAKESPRAQVQTSSRAR